jgi:hypothetical protein
METLLMLELVETNVVEVEAAAQTWAVPGCRREC